jgi:hypothetical protein
MMMCLRANNPSPPKPDSINHKAAGRGTAAVIPVGV